MNEKVGGNWKIKTITHRRYGWAIIVLICEEIRIRTFKPFIHYWHCFRHLPITAHCHCDVRSMMSNNRRTCPGLNTNLLISCIFNEQLLFLPWIIKFIYQEPLHSSPLRSYTLIRLSALATVIELSHSFLSLFLCFVMNGNSTLLNTNREWKWAFVFGRNDAVWSNDSSFYNLY